MTSVTTSGVTKNYTYDAAGNVTADGAHTDVYDGDTGLRWFNSGATNSLKTTTRTGV